MSELDLSQALARQVRGGYLPHLPPPASPVSSRVELVLEAPDDANPEAIFSDPRREHGWRVALSPSGKGYWKTSVLLPQEPTILRYYFELADGTIIREHRQYEGEMAALYGVWLDQDYRIAVYNPQSTPPSWLTGQVMYQIFPDRFARANVANTSDNSHYNTGVVLKNWDESPEKPSRGRDFFGGNLRGVINKLAYLQELGITCIYFTPIFEAPSNHRYDAIDYFRIDPRLGSEADLRELIEEAQARGIRVMLDGVFNHCSPESVYFKAARADKTSPYYRWFNFTRWPDEWVGWLDVKTMPEFVECPEIEQFFFGKGGVAQHWLEYGTAGWRTDVTPWLTDEYWRRFRAAVRQQYPEAYLISEDWGDASHRLLGDSFDATMNYRFGFSVAGWAAGKLSSPELDDRLETLRRDTPPAQFLAQMNLLGSHDTMRLLTRLNGDKARLKLAVALQMVYPGVPMVYYGDEAGLEGEYAEDGRRPFPWNNPDETLLAFFRKLIHTRRTCSALQTGSLKTVYASQHGYGIVRQSDTEQVLALFNNSETVIEVEIPVDEGWPTGLWTDLLGNLPPVHLKGNCFTTTLPALGIAWFAIGSNS
jgi:glycosidase